MLLRAFIIIVLFSNLFEEWISWFTYTDEFLGVILPVYSFFILIKHVKKGRRIFSSYEKILFILVFTISIISILSTIISEYGNTLFLELYTLFANIKYILIYFSFRVLCFNTKNINNIFGFVRNISYVFTISCLLIYIVNLPLNFMTIHSHRFGLANVAYGFGHPSEFALCVILLSALNVYTSLRLKEKINFIYILLNFFLILTAGRVTSIAFIVLILILLFAYRFFRKYVIGGLIVSSIVAIIIVGQKFLDTFISMELPRGILLNTALSIANSHFPFGSGLGTFGSNASRINYSQVYFDYNLNNIWGLSPIVDDFITDSYWAMIIGEYGYIAAFLNLITLLLLIIISFSSSNIGIISVVASIPALYLVLSSPVDSAILSNSSLILMFTMALLVTTEYQSRKIK